MSNDKWMDITTDEAKALLNDKEIQFVDVREQDEYDAGHIPNITHLPLSQLVERAGELDQNQEMVIVCRSGNRSSQACAYLSSIGYNKLKNLDGGMMYWDGEVVR